MFAKRLQLLRQEMKWTQSDLAEKLGVSKSTIGMYELGNRTPDNELLVAIAELFKVTTDYLLGRTDHPRAIKLPPTILTLEDALNDKRFIQFASDYLAMIQTAARELAKDRALAVSIAFEDFQSLDREQQLRLLSKAFDSVSYESGGNFKLIPKRLSSESSKELLEKLKSLPQEEQQAILKQLYG